HATEALRIGLVNRVVAGATLAETAAAWAAEIAQSPREGLAATKEIVAAIRSGKPGGDPAAYGAALRTGAAARERIRAFVERRRPGGGTAHGMRGGSRARSTDRARSGRASGRRRTDGPPRCAATRSRARGTPGARP